MFVPSPDEIIAVGVDILKSIRDRVTKSILFQTGDVRAEQPEADQVESWQHVGFVSIPPRPKKRKQAAQCVVIRRSDHDVSIASRDLRGQELAGDLQDGDTCVYAPGPEGEGQARVLLKGDGSVHVYSRKGGAPGATGMVIQLDAPGNAIRLLNADGHGLIIDSEGVKLLTGGATLELTAAGAASLAASKNVQIDGSSIVLGSTVVPVANGALVGPTGLAGVSSQKVLIALA